MKTSPFYLDLLSDLGAECGDANQRIYRVTISRVLLGVAVFGGFRDIENLTRQDVDVMIRDAFDDPLPLGVTSAGRPRTRNGVLVELVVVVKETHADGSAHFHAVLKLGHTMRFKQAKLTLRDRHKLPSHWSCSRT